MLEIKKIITMFVGFISFVLKHVPVLKQLINYLQKQKLLKYVICLFCLIIFIVTMLVILLCTDRRRYHCIYKCTHIDKIETLLFANSNANLYTILEDIKNNKSTSEPKELQLQSYKLASYVEEMILNLKMQDYDFMSISIIPNKYPSTNWRFNSLNELLPPITNDNQLKYFVYKRNVATRQQTNYSNIIRIIDYKDDSCELMHNYYENVPKHQLISLHHNIEFEHGIEYGAYWILKFRHSKNFYIFSSPRSYQLDKSMSHSEDFTTSQRSFYILTPEQFSENIFYKYLVLRIDNNLLQKFLKY